MTIELTLSDDHTGARVTIEPNRGGLVTRFDIGDRPILFMDAQTLRDPTKNVRGGIPVLFPSPGKLVDLSAPPFGGADGRGQAPAVDLSAPPFGGADGRGQAPAVDDAWAYAGQRGSMKQHGFARNLPWQVVHTDDATATLTLAASDATRAQFPWDFAVEQTFMLRGRSLCLDQRVTNCGAAPMPFGFGFHPYFFVPDAAKRATTIATAATRAFDNVAKQTIALSAPAKIDLTLPEVDLHLLDHGSTASELRTPAGTIQVRGSAEYTHWVVWTLAGKDFVCLEPWTCPGNALNTGDRLIVLPPGESRALSLEISA